MNKKLVLSIEQMQKLESLGLDTSNASMYYDHIDGLSLRSRGYPKYEDDTPAYTFQDILNMLPNEVIFRKVQCGFGIGYFWWYKEYNDSPVTGSDNELTSAYEMLLWCIKNNHIKTNN